MSIKKQTQGQQTNKLQKSDSKAIIVNQVIYRICELYKLNIGLNIGAENECGSATPKALLSLTLVCM